MKTNSDGSLIHLIYSYIYGKGGRFKGISSTIPTAHCSLEQKTSEDPKEKSSIHLTSCGVLILYPACFFSSSSSSSFFGFFQYVLNPASVFQLFLPFYTFSSPLLLIHIYIRMIFSVVVYSVFDLQ